MSYMPAWWSEIQFFTREEFACKCGKCDGYPAEMNEELVRGLDRIRYTLDRPMHVTSGLRCVDNNKAAGGVPDSAHLSGKAADIAVNNSRERYELISVGLIPFHRIGIGKDFVHYDVDRGKPGRVMWRYGEK